MGSDGDAALPIPANDPKIRVLKLVETGLLQEVTSEAFPGYPAKTEPFRVYVQSDLNPVPEPSSVLLFASGLAGFAGWGWIRRSARSRRNIIGNGGPAAAQRS